MQKTIKKIRAFELLDFLRLKCLPRDLSNVRNYATIHGVRLILEKAVPDFVEKFDEVRKKTQEEFAPFEPQIREMMMTDREAAIKLDQEAQMEVQKLIQPLVKKNDKYVLEHANEEVTVEIDEEALNQVKLFFEKLTVLDGKEVPMGSTYFYWNDAEKYLEVARFLGSI